LLESKTQQTTDKCWVFTIVLTQPTGIACAAISHFIDFLFLISLLFVLFQLVWVLPFHDIAHIPQICGMWVSTGLPLKKLLTVERANPKSVAKACWLGNPLRFRACLTLSMDAGEIESDRDIEQRTLN